MNSKNFLHKPKPIFKVKDNFILEIAAIQRTTEGYIYLIKNSNGLWIKESDIKRFEKINKES